MLGEDIKLPSDLKNTLGIFTQFNKTQPDYFENFGGAESTLNTPNVYRGKYFEKKVTEDFGKMEK